MSVDHVKALEVVIEERTQAVLAAQPHLTEAEAKVRAYHDLLAEALECFSRALGAEKNQIATMLHLKELYLKFEKAIQDSRRLDCLEELAWSQCVGNGIALIPTIGMSSSQRHIEVQDLGSEDGSNLGDELTEPHPSLRTAIDSLMAGHH